MLLGRRSREKPMEQETKSETNRHKWQNGNCMQPDWRPPWPSEEKRKWWWWQRLQRRDGDEACDGGEGRGARIEDDSSDGALTWPRLNPTPLYSAGPDRAIAHL